MRKIYGAMIVAAIFSTQVAFADDMMVEPQSKECGMIAKACLDAGYTRQDSNGDKKFWQDCMKPVVLGKSVQGVTIDAATAKTCRMKKIGELKAELKEFQKAK